jgi:hypothetical protein
LEWDERPPIALKGKTAEIRLPRRTRSGGLMPVLRESWKAAEQMDAEENTHETTGTPRWVKVAAIIALVVVVMIVVMLLVGGDHGPGRH